ncbi:hypothetical protein CEP52_002467 [Fusarium oligoseptatum]|uniref:Uncharacterized protein n=1 Tax=Fusarium oligoseptatum TaxID=2604345 RepID=A0A428UDI6_9HYPO|nr:hypothetical protein CEP52_002467 [Fusarium oligoseptatum]
MNWLRHDSGISDGDMKTFFFQDRGTSRILSLSKPSRFSPRKRFWNLSGEPQWQSWFNAGHLKDSNHGAESTLNILFCDRVEKSDPHPLVVAHLPFTKTIFDQVRTEFRVHGSIARVINRNTRCAFMDVPFEYAEDEGDVTIGICPFETSRSTTVEQQGRGLVTLLYPCPSHPKHSVHMLSYTDVTKRAADFLTSRLTGTDHPVFHPMLLPTLLADMERERQVDLLRKNSAKMDQLTVDLTINKGLETTESDSQLVQNKELIELWQDMSYLQNGFQNWQRQMQRMLIHLERSPSIMEPDTICYNVEAQRSLEKLTMPGVRIQKRLEELIDEYDEHIRDCATVTEGLKLAMSMDTRTTNQEIAHSNLEVSRLAQKDGSLMKLIAFVTMFFLPATFTSTFFSMDFFDWPKAVDAITTGKLILRKFHLFMVRLS